MKTAISIPDSIFSQAEKLARHLGITRSELYKRAIEQFLKEKDTKEMMLKLNEIYGHTKSNVDKEFIQAQLKSLSLEKEEW